MVCGSKFLWYDVGMGCGKINVVSLNCVGWDGEGLDGLGGFGECFDGLCGFPCF